MVRGLGALESRGEVRAYSRDGWPAARIAQIIVETTDTGDQAAVVGAATGFGLVTYGEYTELEMREQETPPPIRLPLATENVLVDEMVVPVPESWIAASQQGRVEVIVCTMPGLGLDASIESDQEAVYIAEAVLEQAPSELIHVEAEFAPETPKQKPAKRRLGFSARTS